MAKEGKGKAGRISLWEAFADVPGPRRDASGGRR